MSKKLYVVCNGDGYWETFSSLKDAVLGCEADSEETYEDGEYVGVEVFEASLKSVGKYYSKKTTQVLKIKDPKGKK